MNINDVTDSSHFCWRAPRLNSKGLSPPAGTVSPFWASKVKPWKFRTGTKTLKSKSMVYLMSFYCTGANLCACWPLELTTSDLSFDIAVAVAVLCVIASVRYELLHVLNFDPVRRRMSVIVRSSSGERQMTLKCVLRLTGFYGWPLALMLLACLLCLPRRHIALLQRRRLFHFPPRQTRGGGADTHARGAQCNSGSTQSASLCTLTVFVRLNWDSGIYCNVWTENTLRVAQAGLAQFHLCEHNVLEWHKSFLLAIYLCFELCDEVTKLFLLGRNPGVTSVIIVELHKNNREAEVMSLWHLFKKWLWCSTNKWQQDGMSFGRMGTDRITVFSIKSAAYQWVTRWMKEHFVSVGEFHWCDATKICAKGKDFSHAWAFKRRSGVITWEKGLGPQEGNKIIKGRRLFKSKFCE